MVSKLVVPIFGKIKPVTHSLEVLMTNSQQIINLCKDVGMVVREVWWMGRCLLQGTGRCGVWMVDDLRLFS